MAHGEAREEKWRGNWRKECVTSKRHMTVEHRLARAVQTLQTDVHSSPASSRVNWFPHLFKWTPPLRWKTKSDFCACAITFQTQSNISLQKVDVVKTAILETRPNGKFMCWKLLEYLIHFSLRITDEVNAFVTSESHTYVQFQGDFNYACL